MLQRLRCARAALGIHLEQPCHEVLGLHRAPEEALREDRFHVVLPAGGELTRQQRVSGNADAPTVNLVRVGSLAHLGGQVALRPDAPRHRFVAWRPMRAQAEVDELHHVPVIARVHQVLALDVAVHDALVVQMLCSPQRLLHDTFRSGLGEHDSLPEVLQYGATLEELHDQVHVRLGFVELLQLRHVGVLDGSLNPYRVVHVRDVPARQQVPPNGLDSHLLVVLLPNAPDDLAAPAANGEDAGEVVVGRHMLLRGYVTRSAWAREYPVLRDRVERSCRPGGRDDRWPHAGMPEEKTLRECRNPPHY
mmetsp:Transcript_71716/g.154835  ORF Transcript_71716/g.154835 Transcript_71716/m.154835 type:complete len:306 (-) Transcript_71716:111-1028(-)